MDLMDRAKLYLQRAKNELNLARAIFKLSCEEKLKTEFELTADSTFFSNVIANSYYCIFYSAKAILASRGIRTFPPEEHKKTLNEFEKLVDSGKIDIELLRIYKSIVVKAEELLNIFQKEKGKRGKFTYQKLPQANLQPARESLDNAEKFFRNIYLIIEKETK
ncbi:MAG: hypothetical protein V1886_00605 [archaeon]